MKLRIALTAALLSLAPLTAAGNGWAMSSGEWNELQTAHFAGKSPEYIARFFAHPNGSVSKAAVDAMTTQHGKTALPILEKLVTDSHPFVRRGAVRVLTRLYIPGAGDKRRRRDAPAPVMTPELKKMLAMVEPLSSDPHPAVSQAVAELNVGLEVDSPATRKMALFMAGNSDKDIRGRAIKIAQSIIRDPDTQVKIGITVSGFPDNVARTWGHAHQLISKHKDDPVSRQAVPALADFLYEVANVQPVRGMFSDSPQSSALDTLQAQWDEELEAMPKVVPAVCRVFVRVPTNWMTTRAAALDILKQMSPSTAPAIKAAASEERKWITEISDTEFLLFDRGASRKLYAEAVDYLDYIATCLESGAAITKKSPIAIEEEKLYLDKVPEPGALDLDIDLE